VEVDRFASTQNQNDLRIIHIVEYISLAETRHFPFLCVCQIHFVDSELKRRWKFIFYGEVTRCISGWRCNF